MKSVNSRATRAAIPAQISSTGLVIEGTAPPQLLLGFLDSVFRGIGQVMLQSNSYTGLLFLIGIFYNSMLFGWAILLGTTASTATAIFPEVDRTYRRADCWGSIDGSYRGRGLLRGLYERLKKEVAGRYDIGGAFVAEDSPHSLHAHIDGLGMIGIGNFVFSDKRYEILAFSVAG